MVGVIDVKLLASIRVVLADSLFDHRAGPATVAVSARQTYGSQPHALFCVKLYLVLQQLL